MRCPSCTTDVAAGSRFCGACGSAVPPNSQTATAAMPPPLGAMHEKIRDVPRDFETSKPRRSLSEISSEEAEGRFPPGTLLADRYRVVALLGKGGMGEVYRAYDLMLGQPVALKFLAESSVTDAGLLSRFRSEVRIARQVSHPNVCRVYDIGEVQDLVYMSMEYVDGENLASLLRRIGRLPSERAVEMA